MRDKYLNTFQLFRKMFTQTVHALQIDKPSKHYRFNSRL